MSNSESQQLFFQKIRSILPENLSLADRVADLLNISADSAYRRIRGEKPLLFDEIRILCSEFRISTDQFFQVNAGNFVFSGKLANAADHVFDSWVDSILQQLTYVAAHQDRRIFYLAKDIPLMQQFLMPELAAFKFFFWQKSILHYEELKGLQFSLEHIPPESAARAAEIVDVYNRIDSIDIWNIESINSTIRQIEFYRASNAFASDADVKKLYRAVLAIIDHLQAQAECGRKYIIGSSPAQDAAQYLLYNNELILGDNTLLFEIDGERITILNHSVINFISTRDAVFNNYMFNTIDNLLRKSTPLSISNEKERSRFFNRVRDKISAAARL